MRSAHSASLIIALALIAGWFTRVAYEMWPTWQPMVLFASVFVLNLLAAWIERLVRAGRKAADA